MASNFFQVKGLESGYGEVQVLWGVDLEVAEAEIVCLVGSNGAGKSTLLRTISALVKPTAGQILLKGEDITQATSEDIVTQRIVHVPEGRRLFSAMSVHDNLLMGAYKRDDKARIREDLDYVYEIFPRLAERMNQAAGTLSGGEQQMCAIARGIMGDPTLMMIDELSLGLAPRIVDELGETLLTINKKGISILLVEQDVMIAFEIAHRGFVMDSGRVTLSGSTKKLAKDPAVQEAYMGLS